MKFSIGATALLALLGWAGPGRAASATEAWREIEQEGKTLPKLQQQRDQGGAAPDLFAAQSGEADQAIAGELALLMLHLEAFIRQYPEDKRVMQARAWWVLTAPQASAALGTSVDHERYGREFALLEKTQGLPADIQVDVDYTVIRSMLEKLSGQGVSKADYDGLLLRMEEYSRKFPRDWRAPGVAYTLGRILEDKDEARAHAAFAAAARSSDEGMAADAETALAVLPYHYRPLDLAFKATDGRRIDIADLRGRVVVVDFWATWCPPCREEAPDMVALYHKYHDRGVEFVGISLDENRKKLAQFTAANGLTWPQYFDGRGWDSKVGQRFRIHSIPTVWVVGRDGHIVSSDARGNLEEIVQALAPARSGAPPVAAAENSAAEPASVEATVSGK